jgi:hypothetical protein
VGGDGGGVGGAGADRLGEPGTAQGQHPPPPDPFRTRSLRLASGPGRSPPFGGTLGRCGGVVWGRGGRFPW